MFLCIVFFILTRLVVSLEKSHACDTKVYHYTHYTSISKIMIIFFTVPEICCVMDVFFFILGYFLPFYAPSIPKNHNLTKMKKKKNTWRCHLLHMCMKNYDQMMYSSSDKVHDGWMDR